MQACPVCKENHHLYQCVGFKKMNIDKRRQVVQNNNLCFNCLRSDHRVKECKSSSCKMCNKKHNTLLHIANTANTSVTAQLTTEDQHKETSQILSNNNHNVIGNQTLTSITSSALQNESNLIVMLPTALINILDNNGVTHKCRALLDSGSQATLVTEACVQRLGIKRKYDQTTIFGLGNNHGNNTKGKVQLNICINADKKIITTEALCLKNLTQILPPRQIEKDKFNYFNNLQMADPYFNQPTKVDIILGANVIMDCCLPQKLVHPSGTPTALNTVFGWVLMGQVRATSNNIVISNYVSTNLDQMLKQF